MAPDQAWPVPAAAAAGSSQPGVRSFPERLSSRLRSGTPLFRPTAPGWSVRGALDPAAAGSSAQKAVAGQKTSAPQRSAWHGTRVTSDMCPGEAETGGPSGTDSAGKRSRGQRPRSRPLGPIPPGTTSNGRHHRPFSSAMEGSVIRRPLAHPSEGWEGTRNALRSPRRLKMARAGS